jgi:muramidase (phage lysozyme)
MFTKKRLKMTRSTSEQLGGANRQSFLDMIASSEIGAPLLAVTDDGYNVLVGATASNPLIFQSYATHPNILNAKLDSTAAGRYQDLHKYAVAYIASLNLPDFGPESQDAIAIQQIKECGALPDIDAGNFASAVTKCARIWASLPGNNYNQHENAMATLQAAYVAAGGTLAS